MWNCAKWSREAFGTIHYYGLNLGFITNLFFSRLFGFQEGALLEAKQCNAISNIKAKVAQYDLYHMDFFLFLTFFRDSIVLTVTYFQVIHRQEILYLHK